MPKSKLDEEFADDLISNPEKYKAKWLDEIRREQPGLTEEQIEGQWELLCLVAGF